MGNYNEKFMRLALHEALKSYKKGDVPVGCVITQECKIISSSHNTQNSRKVCTFHAEMLAIQSACEKLGRSNLSDCTMYVTLEPCLMCLGAIINAKISTLYIGAASEQNGAVISKFPLVKDDAVFPYKLDYYFKKTISPYILKRFFKKMRRGNDEFR